MQSFMEFDTYRSPILYYIYIYILYIFKKNILIDRILFHDYLLKKLNVIVENVI